MTKTIQERVRELLDNPRTGLRASSDTNKTRMEIFGILEEVHTQAVEEENKRCVAVVRSQLIMYPDSQRVQEDPYNFALLNAERALTNKQNV